MSDVKHTPGPWAMHDHNAMAKFGDDPNDWIGYAWVGYDNGGGFRFNGKVACLDRRKDGNREFRERASADARLIAAAPELLEALIAMEAEKSDYMRRNYLGDPEQEHTNKLARAAIAKALGDQP